MEVNIFLFSADECLFLLLNLIKQDVLSCQETLFSYVSTVMFPVHKVRNKYTSMAMKIMKKVYMFSFFYLL